MNDLAADIAIGAVAGLILGLIASPMVYGVWRGRTSPMLAMGGSRPASRVSPQAWTGVGLLLGVFLLVLAQIIHGVEMLEFAGTVVIACGVAFGVGLVVTCAAQTRETRGHRGE